jgi:hypothetical protein
MTAEIVRCQQTTMQVSDKLAMMLMTLVSRIGAQGKFRSYSFVDDMKSEALLQLVRSNNVTPCRTDTRPNILKFDVSFSERKGTKPNPFSYATQIVMNVFRRHIRLEANVTSLKDDILEGARLTPSAKRQIYNDEHRSSLPIQPRPKSNAGRKKKKVLGVTAVGSVG